MNKLGITGLLVAALTICLMHTAVADACTRLIYGAGNGRYLTARSMDWTTDMPCAFWTYPRGMAKDGGVDPDSIKWTAKYGSVTLSGFDAATVDGMNEKGLVANILYLVEADYGERNGKPGISLGAWTQYVLDNFATVSEAVEALRAEPFRIVPAMIPGGIKPGAHLAITDASGDSAIFEYLEGELVIHHGKQYTVMTNSPTYDQQLALKAYWEEIGGLVMLPGTNRAADRFVRASYYTKAAPDFEDERLAVGAAFSIIRNVSVPLGIKDPSKPNISTTLWRTVSDPKSMRYYYDSAITPNIFWVDVEELEFGEGTPPKKIDLVGHPIMAGDISSHFEPATPFKWLAPEEN